MHFTKMFTLGQSFNIVLKRKDLGWRYCERVSFDRTIPRWNYFDGTVSVVIPISQRLKVSNTKDVTLQVNDFGMRENPCWSIGTDGDAITHIKFQHPTGDIAWFKSIT